MSHIFVSYSRENTDCVRRTVNRLEALGYRVWFDRTSIPGGDDWRQSIRKGVNGADAALVFWSATAATSDYVGKEVELSLGRQFSDKIPVIPVRLDDTPLSDALKNHQSPTLTDCESYAAFQKLLPSLPDSVRRATAPLDKHIPIAEQPNATPRAGLVTLPYLTSVHATATVVAESSVTVRDALNRESPTVALLVECLGGVDDDQFLRRAYAHFHDAHPQTPFLGLHVRGPANADGQLRLDNDAPGQWLDVAHVCESAAMSLFGRGAATLDVYLAAPAALSVGIGTRFGPRFWRLRVHNYNPQASHNYELVYDTADLPQS